MLGNVDVTRRLLAATKKSGDTRKFCYISSLTAVGPSADGTPLTENSECRPITSYGESKLEAERVCKEFSADFPVVIVRPPAVYGPRDSDILDMFRWIKFGLMPVIGSRQKTMSLIYAPELARAIGLATTSQRADGETYFVADEEQYGFSELVDIVARLFGRPAIRLPIPKALVYSIAAATQAVSWILPKPSVVNIDKVKDLLTPHWVCNPTKIQRELGFTTAVQAEEGLRRTLDWYREQKWL
jgi:nucleoside-diphosphate-sugar epimerase